jgi:hypothetical protein
MRTTPLNPVAEELAREYPLLWEKAQHADFSERSGYTPEPLIVEADRAMHEIWLARMAAREA